MFDQSFSAENFYKIFDRENRNGDYLEKRFFPKVVPISEKIKKHNAKNIEKNKELEDERKVVILEELQKISAKINDRQFLPDIKELGQVKEKPIYGIMKDDACSYFAIKQSQDNLEKLYKIKQSNRFDIIPQLRQVLSDIFPKHIIRTDIVEFYERIPRDYILKKLYNDNLLTPISKKIIRQTLQGYEKVSGNSLGLPRGIGISPYLAEIYMRKFDKTIQNFNDVIYYARYVDDIIIVYSPELNTTSRKKRLKYIKDELEKIHLETNNNKTIQKIINEKERALFNYLGYKFFFSKKNLKISISTKKICKYKDRIRKTFENYHASVKYDQREANKLLIKRIRFLTGNTRLVNNKKNMIVGIHFSHRFINDASCLKALDKLLCSKVKELPDGKVKNKLYKLSFLKGFENKKFYKFSAIDLKNIVSVWRYVKK